MPLLIWLIKYNDVRQSGNGSLWSFLAMLSSSWWHSHSLICSIWAMTAASVLRYFHFFTLLRLSPFFEMICFRVRTSRSVLSWWLYSGIVAIQFLPNNTLHSRHSFACGDDDWISIHITFLFMVHSFKLHTRMLLSGLNEALFRLAARLTEAKYSRLFSSAHHPAWPTDRVVWPTKRLRPTNCFSFSMIHGLVYAVRHDAYNRLRRLCSSRKSMDSSLSLTEE